MINTFRLYQSLVIFLLVSLWVITAVGAIEYFQWQSAFAPGLLIHSGIIFICLVGTAFIFKSVEISALFDAVSFKKTAWRYYFIAFVMAAIVWVADYYLQLFLFLDDGKNDGLVMQKDIQQYGSISVILAICFLAPIAEEILFRGILLKGLLDKLGSVESIIISSLIFAGIHFSANDFLTLFVVATGYAILTLKTNSIRPAIFAHTINNSVTVFYLLAL